MMRGSEITDALVRQLESVKSANGYATDLRGVYTHAEVVPDGAQLPCALVNIENPDVITGRASTQATRERTYSIQVVFRRGATETELNAANNDVLRCLGFGKHEYEREMQGLITEEQETSYEFAAKGSNYTTVTILVTFVYVETY